MSEPSPAAAVSALAYEPLLESILEPLAGAAGDFGAMVTELCAQSLASRMGS